MCLHIQQCFHFFVASESIMKVMELEKTSNTKQEHI